LISPALKALAMDGPFSFPARNLKEQRTARSVGPHGKFHHSGMADAISRARDTMMAVCRMEGDGSVIPREYLSDYKGTKNGTCAMISAS
jgi:hypothetical protein